MERRKFIIGIPALAVLNSIQPLEASVQNSSDFDRFSDYFHQIREPVFGAWCKGELIKTLDRSELPRKDRMKFAALEVVARIFYPLCQIDKEGAFLTSEILAALEKSLQPGHADSFNWNKGDQPLVDAAILAAGFLQNPLLFEKKLNPKIQSGIIEGWRNSLKIKPYESNWLLFAAMVEGALQKWDKPLKPECIPYAIQKFEEWYVGDSFYADGPRFHMDYYNSIIIHPFLLILGKQGLVDKELAIKHMNRAKRHVEILERMVTRDGGFPPLGRSLCYRAGLFHHLAFMAKEEMLPASVSFGAAKKAITLAIEKTLHIKNPDQIGTNAMDLDTKILRPGLFGFEPQLAEVYINTASLYLCTWAFLPLALGKNHEFWNMEKALNTSDKMQMNQSLGIDVALKD